MNTQEINNVIVDYLANLPNANVYEAPSIIIYVPFGLPNQSYAGNVTIYL